ncbi:Hypothetical predicted protein [Octopus vulgaris]|uniref:Uncharacterized protein n=2 Tax=Octopus TaxID=6643 RepID=A0AA36F0F5_OCTVU|nr:protein FAM219A isoform X4 [Octopus sinensis]CAI9718388.1 Hypothetical predicted protein [Octopus vulgaris]
MDGMEDSGFDSDPKPVTQTEQLKKIENSNHAKNGAHIKALKKASELQKKIERQRDASRKTQNLAIDQQPKRSFLARNSSEDDFTSHLSKTAHKEITEQLIKDGFNLDLEPDDEDLDLIPPRPMNERCVCCNMHSNCALQ